MSNLRKPPFAWVRLAWEDAFTDDEWQTVEDYVIHDQIVQSEGYLVKENEKYVAIAANVSYNADLKTWSMMGALIITRRMIIGEIEVVRRAPGSRKKKAAPVSEAASQ